MTTETQGSADGSEQPRYFTIFHFMALTFAVGIVMASGHAGWKSGGPIGLIAGTLFGLVLAPLAFLAAFFGIVGALGAVVFITCEFIEWDRQAKWLRTCLRIAVIVGALAWISYGVPRLITATTWKDWKEEALVFVLFPVSAVVCLYIPRFEPFSKLAAEKTAEGGPSTLNEGVDVEP